MSLSLDLMTQDALRSGVPLWLAGVGELVVQRAGVINIGIEGLMLPGALAGWAATVATGSPGMGLLGGGGAGVLLAGLFAVVTLGFGADQVVAGTAINLLAVGATGVGFTLCLEHGLAERSAAFFTPLEPGFLPIAALDQFGLFHATLVLILAVELMLRFSRFGVELVALGEYPVAADAAGIHVNLRRAGCVLFGGLLAGLAGAYLSTMFNTQFSPHMTAGRGFLALAMVIFGRWRPVGLLAGGMLFGYVYAVANHFEVSPVSWLPSAPVLQMAPYLLSLVVLAGLLGHARSPTALGQPFERE